MAVLRTGVDWADAQMVDEFRFQFTPCAVELVEDLHGGSWDLLVLPYFEPILADAPGAARCAEVRANDAAWVLLYGLDYRRIQVLPAGKVASYYRRAIRLRRLEWWLARGRVTRLVRRWRLRRRQPCE
ncbi:MAG: hypothetical protein MUC88_19265 [Planctomycetes bacterium]|jgi:hypothetical protein|nr:hypothetical protein [Planctomycetota bacterium]